jgi:surface antigen
MAIAKRFRAGRTCIIFAVLLGFMTIGVIATGAYPALADTTLCSGDSYSVCTSMGFTDHGYGANNGTSYWGMLVGPTGHNCTNYVAYVESTVNGAPTPGYNLGNADDWASNAASHGVTVNGTPGPGSVAQWNAAAWNGYDGHVAYVEDIATSNGAVTSITISEDSYPSGPFDWRVITAGSANWPDNFIHFKDLTPPAPPPATADFLGDGHSDLAWLAGTSPASDMLYLFDGADNFATAGQTGGFEVPEPGVVGDFLGNGQSEIASFEPSEPGGQTGSIYLTSWTGSGWQQTLARGPGVGRPIWVGAGDFAGTGYDDLAWLTAGPGGKDSEDTLWLFDGAHGFATVGQITGLAPPVPGVVGDFYGNGRSEIAWFQYDNPSRAVGTIYLVSWNGSAWQVTTGRGPGVGTPVWAGAGDFAGTGYDDLAWLTAGPDGGPGTLWLFDGAHGFATVGQSGGLALPVPGVPGDYLGNGESQIAWFQYDNPSRAVGTIYLVSWNGSAWQVTTARGPGVGTPSFVATTSASYTGPRISTAPVVRLMAGGKLPAATAGSRVAVTVKWAAAAGTAGICSQQLQESVNGGRTWTAAGRPGPASTSVSVTIPAGKATTFRVRAVGCDELTSGWVGSAPVAARIWQESSGHVRYTKGWRHIACRRCSGGGQEQTAVKGAKATVSLGAVDGFALVFRDSRDDGSATITAGGSTATISTHAARPEYLRYGYAKDWSAAASRTAVITNLATRGHPVLQLDAIITLTVTKRSHVEDKAEGWVWVQRR